MGTDIYKEYRDTKARLKELESEIEREVRQPMNVRMARLICNIANNGNDVGEYLELADKLLYEGRTLESISVMAETMQRIHDV